MSASGGWLSVSCGIHQFLKGHIRLPHKALVYHDKLIGFDMSLEITVQDVVGKRFDIEEILASEPVKHSVVEAAI